MLGSRPKNKPNKKKIQITLPHYNSKFILAPAAGNKLCFCLLTSLCYLLRVSACIWIHNVRWQSSTSAVVHRMNHNIIFHSRLKQPAAAESQLSFSTKTNTKMTTSRAALFCFHWETIVVEQFMDWNKCTIFIELWAVNMPNLIISLKLESVLLPFLSIVCFSWKPQLIF